MSLRRIGILTSGGDSPGLNAVIRAVVKTAREVYQSEVLGIHDGFQWVMEGDVSHVSRLTTADVSRIHFRGGSHIGISRANPTTDPQLLENTINSLLRLNVSQLITIGGDDTAFSAMRLEAQSNGRIRVVHVPKTIDNDLDLPQDINTFGFQTARHLGSELVKNLMVDAQTASRWYFVIMMGRKAGHLALGVGKASGATLTLIAEEFGEGRLKFKTIVDTLVGAIAKRLAHGTRHGVAVIAEGVVEQLDPADLAQLEDVERDAHGNLRIAEVEIGEILKRAVQAELRRYGIKETIVAKNIGYELRCADPIPFDIEYCRDLGYCAAKYLLSGGSGVLISMQAGHFVPIPFAEIFDPVTGRTRVRLVDIRTMKYAIGHRYMIRLRREDFDDPSELARIAAVMKLSLQEFRERYEYLVEAEPPALDLMTPASD